MHTQKETKEGPSLVSRGAGEPIRDLTPAPAAGRRIGRETSIKGGCPLPTMGMFDKAKEQAAKAAAATQVSQSVIKYSRLDLRELWRQRRKNVLGGRRSRLAGQRRRVDLPRQTPRPVPGRQTRLRHGVLRDLLRIFLPYHLYKSPSSPTSSRPARPPRRARCRSHDRISTCSRGL